MASRFVPVTLTLGKPLRATLAMFPAPCHIVGMEKWTALCLALAFPLRAGEVVLCDVDYTASSDLLGQVIPLGDGPFPGRKTCSTIVFGTAVIGPAPPGLAGTAAILTSAPVGSSLNYSQLEFNVFERGVYSFHKHRIEAEFQWVNPAGFSGGDGFRILTDGGMTYSLDFAADGKVTLGYNVPRANPAWPGQTQLQFTPAGTFNPAAPVHVAIETDSNAGTATIIVNGTPVTFTGLVQPDYGTRNGVTVTGPQFIRLSLDDSGTPGPLAIRSFKVTGDDYAGPLIRSVGYPAEPTEAGSVIVPVQVPKTGTWQAEFSENGTDWVPFGSSFTHGFGVHSVVFGSLVAPRMFVRLAPSS